VNYDIRRIFINKMQKERAKAGAEWVPRSYSGSASASHIDLTQKPGAFDRKLGIEASPHEIRRSEDIASVFAALKGHADAPGAPMAHHVGATSSFGFLEELRSA
jgi:hypothetical protein